MESSSRGEERRTGSIILKGRLGEDITCYLKKRIMGDELRARVNYTRERARARAAEIVGGGSARAKHANERNGRGCA